MSRAVYIEDLEAEQAFARRAAAYFADHPETRTFADAEIKPGCFFAVRWGLGEDCVVVLKLDEQHVPTNYMQLVRTVTGPKENP